MKECFLIRPAVCTWPVIESRNLLEYLNLVKKMLLKIICSKKSMDSLLQFRARLTVSIDAGNILEKKLVFTNFFCHNLRACSTTNDWSQTINLCENNDNQLLF